jgi:hypothetical protein
MRHVDSVEFNHVQSVFSYINPLFYLISMAQVMNSMQTLCLLKCVCISRMVAYHMKIDSFFYYNLFIKKVIFYNLGKIRHDKNKNLSCKLNFTCIFSYSFDEYDDISFLNWCNKYVYVKTFCLFVYGFMSCSRIFHLYGDDTIACEGLQNLGLCSALRAFEQRRIFIMPHLLWHRARFTQSLPKDHPIQSPLTTHKGVWRICSNPDPHGSPFSRLFQHTRGCGGSILTQILMGPHLVASYDTQRGVEDLF